MPPADPLGWIPDVVDEVARLLAGTVGSIRQNPAVGRDRRVDRDQWPALKH